MIMIASAHLITAEPLISTGCMHPELRVSTLTSAAVEVAADRDVGHDSAEYPGTAGIDFWKP
jgi:hypothetical protein